MLMQDETVSVKKYVFINIGLLIFTMVIMIVLSLMFSFEIPSMGVILSFVFAMYAGNVFAKDHNRIPTSSEKHSFALGMLVFEAILTVSFVALTVLVTTAAGELSGFESLVAAGFSVAGLLIIAFIGLFVYFIPFFAFWQGARSIMRNNKPVKEANVD